MKKIIMLAIVLTLGTNVNAQIDLKKASATASSLGFDAATVGKSVMDMLTPKLKLSAAQTTKVTSFVNTFLSNKSGYMGLAQSKPSEYNNKFAGEQKTLFNGLKGTLKPEQFTQFLALKPAQTDKANALGQLFY